MTKEKKKIKYSVQFVFIALFFLFIAVTIGLLSTFPTVTSRDIVFSNKRSSMMGQASVMSASLSALEKLGEADVAQVMELVDVGAFDRVAVTDEKGNVLYDTARYSTGEAPDVASALAGDAEFYCRYDGTCFQSTTVAPVMCYGSVIGAVYIYEQDTDQAELIGSIQSRLRTISIAIGALVLLLIVFLTKALTYRLTELVKAMRIVREGNYAHRIAVRGNDEVTELATEFNNMTQRLQSTEELRRRFVSDASHELRTPLASIRLLSDSIVQSDNMDEQTMREFVTDIGTEAERLQRTTEKLLKLTRMDSNAPAARSTVNIKQVVERTKHLLVPLAEQKNVTIYAEKLDDCLIFAVQDDIYQIIFNLAENAIKYNSFGGNVFIHLKKQDGKAVLTVEDTGIGIPDADLPYIFDRFYRVDKARSREAGGSGLGLSIVHDAVHSNGGTILVQRRETVGTRFVVTFPLRSASLTETEVEK